MSKSTIEYKKAGMLIYDKYCPERWAEDLLINQKYTVYEEFKINNACKTLIRKFIKINFIGKNRNTLHYGRNRSNNRQYVFINDSKMKHFTYMAS